MDLQKKSSGSTCRNIFPNMLRNTSLDFILDMEVTDHNNITDNKENKKENLLLQEYSLKNRSFWKSVISLATYTTQTVTSGLCYTEDLIFLENNIV